MNKIKSLRKSLKNKKGFTLIELIVVIAVIGILVLLAAPKFLGYTADANVSGMKADAKVLSNAALVYHIDKEEWPVGTAYAETIEGVPAGVDLFALDAKVEKEIKSLKNDLNKYVIDKNSGEVYHIDGVKDKDGILWHGVDAK